MKKYVLFLLISFSYMINAQTPDWYWVKTVKGNDRIIDFASDNTGNIYAVGTFLNAVIGDNGITYPTLKPNYVSIFIVKYREDGTQEWIKTVRSNYVIYDVKLALNTTNNPVIAFFAYGDTIDYMDTVIYSSKLDTLWHMYPNYTNYLNIVEYDSSNGDIKHMKLFDAPPNTYKLIKEIDIDVFGNYYLIGRGGGTRFDTYISNRSMNIKLDKDFNFIWDYPFIYSRYNAFDRQYRFYNVCFCDTLCNFHDMHFNNRDKVSFINKLNTTNGIATRMHSTNGFEYSNFASISFNRNNHLDAVINYSNNIYLDDSISFDSIQFPRMNDTNQSALLVEFDQSNQVIKKSLIYGYYEDSRYLLKNESIKNYYTIYKSYNDNLVPIYVNNDSFLGSNNRLNIIVLDNNLKYLDNRFIDSKNMHLNYNGYGLNNFPTSAYECNRMILDKNSNIIIHYDFRDTLVTDNGIKLAPLIRYQSSSFIAKLGNRKSNNIIDTLTTYTTLNIAPNPASSELRIQIPEDVVIKGYSIYNTLAQLIKKEDPISAYNELIIPLNQLANGQYYISLIDNSNKKYFVKFVKME